MKPSYYRDLAWRVISYLVAWQDSGARDRQGRSIKTDEDQWLD